MKRTVNFARAAVSSLFWLAGATASAHAADPASEQVLVDQNAKQMPAFVLMQAEMTDRDTFFQQYAVPAEVEISRHGGRAQVASFGKEVLEGGWENNWTIMLRFPSLDAARTWYQSPGYQAVIPIRQRATAFGNMVIFPGMPESLLKWRIGRYDGARAALRFPLTLDATPEYVVAVEPACDSSVGSFSVVASFAEADARRATLSVEFKLAPAYVADGRMITSVALRDAAGRRRTIGRLHARQMAPGQWQRVQFEAEARAYRDLDEAIDLDKVTDIELTFSDNRQSVGTGGDIQIRNLKLARQMRPLSATSGQ